MTLYKICTICTLYLSMFQAPGESVAHPVLTVHKMYSGWNFSDNKKLGHPKSASVLHYSAPQCKCEKHKLYLLWVHIFAIQKSLNKVEQLLFCTAEEKQYKLFLMTSSCKGGYNIQVSCLGTICYSILLYSLFILLRRVSWRVMFVMRPYPIFFF